MKSNSTILMIGVSLIFLSILLPISAKVPAPYSYLPAPPVTWQSDVSPDQEYYQMGDTINFAVVIQLDPYQIGPADIYYIYFGDPEYWSDNGYYTISGLAGDYRLTAKTPLLSVNFTATMLRAGDPPDLKVAIVRLAAEKSANVKQYRGLYIDQYEAFDITAPAFAAKVNNGYGNSKD